MTPKILIIIIGILLVLPLSLSQGEIINLAVNQPLPDFIAGETVTTVFDFDYPDISGLYPYQKDNAALILLVNITSNDSNYPVWKGDFEIDGVMNEINEFECVEDSFSFSGCGNFESFNISNGTYYCTDENYLEMSLNSNNRINLSVSSHPALWPGKYYFSIGLYYIDINKTDLFVSPSIPNGLNGWYISAPNFTLVRADNASIYYRWDSTGPLLYTSPFGLENIPNIPPNDSAGILELNYWSDVCGGEPEQNRTFYVDLKNPIINDLIPANNSIVYSSQKPLISAYLDDVYQSNSGINKNSVRMTLDGLIVNPSILDVDSIDAIINYFPSWYLSEGQHNVSVYVEDNAGRNSSLNWFFFINLSAPLFDLTIYSPFEPIYDSRRVQFNITTSDDVELIEYINLNDRRPRWRRLCRNCDEYGFFRKKTKSLNEGENNVSFRAEDEFGFVVEKNISFFIDSKKPRIRKILPRINSVINSSEFYIKYTEDNLENINLFINGINMTKTDCEAGKNKECIFSDIDLSTYDGQWIEYYFEASDIVRSVQSRVVRVKVDTTSPVLNVNIPEDGEVYDRRVVFNISVSEDVRLEYYDDSVARPRWRRLCTRCDEYGFDRLKRKSFKKGSHDILISAIDKAGNSDVEEISFDVGY